MQLVRRKYGLENRGICSTSSWWKGRKREVPDCESQARGVAAHIEAVLPAWSEIDAWRPVQVLRLAGQPWE